MLNDLLPYLVTLQGLSVANDYKAVLCASQCNIDSAVGVQEANTVFIVASDGRHDHELLLTPLPAVDGLHVFFDTQGLHLAFDLLNLALIRCNKAKFLDIILSHLLQVL